MDTTTISVTNLNFNYDQQTVFKNLNFTLNQGENVC